MARGVGGIGPANIMKHLKGIHFPINKGEIVKLAEGKRGKEFPDTEKVIDMLGKLPEREYSSVADVMKEVGKIE